VFLVVSLRVFQPLSPPQESSEVALGQRNPGQRRLVGGWNATRFEIIPVLGYSGKRASSLVDRVCFEAVGLQAVGDRRASAPNAPLARSEPAKRRAN